MPDNKPYEIKTAQETGWTGWQTALVAVITPLLTEYAGMNVTTAAAIAGFISASSRPVLGYLMAFLPRKS